MDYRLPVVAAGDGSLALVNHSFVKKSPSGTQEHPLSVLFGGFMADCERDGSVK